MHFVADFWSGILCCTSCAAQREGSILRPSSLFLAPGSSVLLALAGDNLAQHDDSVAIHEGHAREALAVLEGVAHKRLLGLEAALCHLVGLQGVGVLHLLASRLLPHLPLELGNAPM